MTAREQAILECIEDGRPASYEALARRFRVSAMTIRRDVDRLARHGSVIKTLGGAQKAQTGDGHLHESALLARLAVRRREKQAIARRALDLLQPGQTVFMDGSTTCLELAKLLACEKRGLTVVTNSLMICREVGRNSENAVIGLGGQYDPASLSFVGAACEAEAAKFFPDLAIFSTKGFIPDDGTYESFVPTLHIKQIVAGHSQRVVLLVDHTKFGQRALRRVLEISQVQDVITDALAPASALAQLAERGVRVWTAVAGTGKPLKRQRRRIETGEA